MLQSTLHNPIDLEAEEDHEMQGIDDIDVGHCDLEQDLITHFRSFRRNLAIVKISA